MSDEILKDYMKKFPLESLKDFLGRDLTDSLLEWQTGNELALTRAKLSEMILCVYGVNILKQKEFRKQLLKSFAREDILAFRVFLPDKYKNSEDLEVIVRKISDTSWKKNKINGEILRLLAYSEAEIFPDNDTQVISSEKVQSYDKFYELLDYQYIIRQKALNILESPYKLKRFLIHMPTGTGKTKTAVHIISHHYNYNLKKKGLILWVAHTTELLQQAYDTFTSVWKNIGNGEINVYKCWGDYEPDNMEEEMSGFMVCGIQKLQALMKRKENVFQQLICNTRLLVYDEAHKAAATETRNVIEQFMIRKCGMEDCTLMGLSATPGRTTGLSFDNNLLVSMFGNKIISIDTKLMNAVNMSAQEAANTDVESDIIKYFQKRGVLAKIKKEELVYPDSISKEELKDIRVIATANGYDDFSPVVLEMIGKNKSRNLKILQRLRELYRQNIPTIVFACSVKHGQLLSSMLTLENIPNALVIGDMLPKDRQRAIDNFKDRNNPMNILINYEVLTTGFDATNIECVFIARPTQSVVLYSQMLGRGLRGPQMGGNEECLLIDVKDNLSQFNENMAFSHFNNYWNS